MAGRAGSLLVAAHYGLVLAALAVLAGPILAFLADPSAPPDLTAAAPLINVASLVDLVGVGVIALAFVAIGAGCVLMVYKDPFTGTETRAPRTVAVLAKGSALAAVAWLSLTVAWRQVLPTLHAWTAPFPVGGGPTAVPVAGSAGDLLAAYAATGLVSPASALQTMMYLWVLAAVSLVVAAGLLQSFAHSLPARVVRSRSVTVTPWFAFTLANASLTVGVAVFPLGLVPFQGFEFVFRSLLATRLVVIPIFGILAYVSLQRRFSALGNLALVVPAVRAIPAAEPTDAEEDDEGDETRARRVVYVAPTRGVSTGLERVPLGRRKTEP